MVTPPREFMRTLASETGGRPIFSNDVSAALGQVIRDSRAYYLIAYESSHPDDGKFHKVTVRVKRPRATVFARTGYWAFKRGENAVASTPAAAAVSPAVQDAVDRLADSLRPDADEPAEGRRHLVMPRPADSASALLAAPTISVARGRSVGEPVTRREFRRIDTLVVRALLRSSGASAEGGRGAGAGDVRPAARSPRSAVDRSAGDAGRRRIRTASALWEISGRATT